MDGREWGGYECRRKQKGSQKCGAVMFCFLCLQRVPGCFITIFFKLCINMYTLFSGYIYIYRFHNNICYFPYLYFYFIYIIFLSALWSCYGKWSVWATRASGKVGYRAQGCWGEECKGQHLKACSCSIGILNKHADVILGVVLGWVDHI